MSFTLSPIDVLLLLDTLLSYFLGTVKGLLWVREITENQGRFLQMIFFPDITNLIYISEVHICETKYFATYFVYKIMVKPRLKLGNIKS